MYENVPYDQTRPELMQKVETAWRRTTCASQYIIPHILEQWKTGKCLLRVNREVLSC